MKLGEDFFPLSWSKNGTIQAVASPALFESFSPWLIDLQKLMEENEKNPIADMRECYAVANDALTRVRSTNRAD